ncbi:hypothetical protein ARMGADRAFT_342342 [Armillaria gallica]|uniref:Uncharacterized protein n=1 Tax=Armillaria gallica TaxID=47427 RepID=A0A2H3D295_ARMGA|nr:hypothetical protein ARMGADRAFT_342342 [Armillaria gallica]
MRPNLDQKESWPRPSMADGFFLSMGGFYCAKQVTSTSSEPLEASTRIVTVSLFNEELEEKLEGISPYSIPEMIADKNKGDALSKTVSVLQISWFIVQCISRVVQRLHITLLEITAVAFAGLSIITYCLWWHKPLNVKHHILVHVGTKSEDKIEYPTTPESKQPNSDTNTVGPLDDFFWRMGAQGFGDRIDSFIKDRKEKIRDIESGAFRFSSGARYERPIGRVVIVMLVGTIFGAFHCTAWSSKFPSYAERVLWQFSCLALLTGLLTEGILLLVEPACEFIIQGELSPTFREGGEAFVTGGTWVAASTYGIARIILLVLAFMELRSLPPLAFRNVQWTTYIPHI